MATLHENYTGTVVPYTAVNLNAATDWAFQSFTTTIPYSLTRIDIYVGKGAGDNVGTISVELYAASAGEPTGSALATGSIDNADVPENGGAGPDWVTCTLSSSYNLSASTQYVIVLHGASLTAADSVYWSQDDDGLGASDFAGGDAGWSINSGSSWSVDTTADYLFKAWGDTIPASDKKYSRSLVAIGNHEVWYQTDSTTMSELSAANNDINTVNPLTAFEAFQKLCIANETNRKIADFSNSKIATDDIGSNPPIRGTVLTGGSSGAVMVCDFITTSSSACTLYGTRTSTATFTSGETVTGTNPATYNFGGTVPYGTAVSFVLNAAEVAAPHWYDWTPYANDTTNFGSLPTSAYISCLYRGRAVLAGHPDYPHQWYMSKVGDIFNWVYGSTDPLTAVAGNNTDAGEIGDIIRALVPYGDDYLVFGCAGSIHILTGDPAFSGQIDEIDNTTGIFSPWSWCRDDGGNLYFFGTNGVYVMEGGRSRPRNISEGYLPKLVDDWAVDPSLHRVVLTYDPLNHGIIITRVTLADGTNLNYFFDLKTQSFYPETYPTACGFFCGLYYPSDTPANRGLVLGCNDGYIRKHLRTAKDDDTGATDTAISSYFTLEMLDLNEQADNKAGKLTSLTFELGGGASSGTFSDSDGCSFDIHVADDAETCLEDIKDGATPIHTGTLSGTGRTRVRTRIRGKWLGIRFYNATASQTFVVNSVSADIRPAGNI